MTETPNQQKGSKENISTNSLSLKYEMHNKILKKEIQYIDSKFNFKLKEKHIEYLNAIDELVDLGLVVSLENNQIKVTHIGRKVYNEIGLEKHIEEIERMAIEKKEKDSIDFQLAKRMLKEYPRTKWMARIGFFIGIVLALFKIGQLFQWLFEILK